MTKPDLILIEGLTFDGRHGLLPGERETGVRFRVDVALEAKLSDAAASDRLADTVDYRQVAELVLEVGTGQSFDLVERLCSVIVDRILDSFPSVLGVRVSVRKLVPVLAGHPECVGVSLRRERSPTGA